MTFTSFSFVLFYSGFIIIYWFLPSRQLKHLFLLAGSAFFCAWINTFFFILVACIAVTSYLGAILVSRYKNKITLSISLGLLVCNLIAFKYLNFFIQSFSSLLQTIGLDNDPLLLQIILPVGVSFYTFQAISYVVDVYTGAIERSKSLLNVILYLSFFPRFIAGPIVRPDYFFSQLDQDVKITSNDFTAGVKALMIGLIYKGVFADNIAPYVNTVYSQISSYDNKTLIQATFAYYSQIYFDFAGYSLMAVGLARLIGYRLPDNFNFPYLATSVSEFWRRWHISLSTWLRDYLYIPLGGNRFGIIKQSRNLMITMLLGGLWHGASWNFVLWGGLHGAGLVIVRFFKKTVPSQFFTSRENSLLWCGCYSLLAWLVTQVFILLCWIPFRAENLAETKTILMAFLLYRDDTGMAPLYPPYFLLFVPIIVDTLIISSKNIVRRQNHQINFIQLVLIGMILALSMVLLPLNVNNFIYVQF